MKRPGEPAGTRQRRFTLAYRISAAVTVLAAAVTTAVIAISGSDIDTGTQPPTPSVSPSTASPAPSATVAAPLLRPAMTTPLHKGAAQPGEVGDQLAVSRDGRRAAAVISGGIRVWDTATKKIVRTIAHQRNKRQGYGPPDTEPELALNTDGSRVAIAHDWAMVTFTRGSRPELAVWDVTTGEKLKVPFGDMGSELIFTGRDILLFSGYTDNGNSLVRRYDFGDPGYARTVFHVDAPVRGLAMSRDNTTLAVATAEKINLYRVNGTSFRLSGKAIVSRPSRGLWNIPRMALSPNARELTTLTDEGVVERWNCAIRKATARFTTSGRDIAYDRQGRLLIPERNVLHVMNDGDDPATMVALVPYTEAYTTGHSFSADDKRLIAVSSDQELILWNLTDQPALR